MMVTKKGKRRKHRQGGSRGYKKRSVERREVRQRFLIVCEGERTEPIYFRSFPLPRLVTVEIETPGNSPKHLVEFAAKRKANGNFDQVWCVFDKDNCKASDFNGALQQAESRKVKVAYSNQAFELWYLLHFDFHQSSIPRKSYESKLSKSLGRAYRKNDPNMYEDLLSRQQTAIRNADRLLEEHPAYNPASSDPSTKVHKLVQELNRFLPGQD